ncbi:MAG: NFACT family protein, partial [Chloroflexota bacterium]|nr:NFACT family protein [Chloroflexota bacterium]
MYDVLTIAAIVDELTAIAAGARIQQVLQVDDLTVALEIYAAHRRRWLVLSAHPERARVHLSERRIDGDAERVTPLLLLLRKYARGGRIVAISQPRYERIVQVSIAKPLEATNRSDDGDGDDEDDDSEELDLTYTELYVELMGRRSNIILTNQDARIFDAVKRVSPEMSRVRPIRPGMQYTPPPPQDKSDPLRAAPRWMIDAARESNETVAKWLVSRFLGVSPLVAREIALRADVDPNRRAAEVPEDGIARIADATRSLFAPLSTADWRPALYTYDDGRALFYAFPLLAVEREEGVERTDVDSIFTAADRASQAASDGVSASGQRHTARRERFVAEIDEARARTSSRLRSLREQVERAQEAESHRRMGEAIYVAFSDIQPGQTELRTEDGLVIPLDPS